MTTISLPLATVKADPLLASAVSEGLTSQPKRLPSWLFYDQAGSRLFDRITRLPEYYLTRTEHEILEFYPVDVCSAALEIARQSWPLYRKPSKFILSLPTTRGGSTGLGS